jgi:hypothetical protein
VVLKGGKQRMAKKYKQMRIPVEIYNNIYNRKKNMENIVCNLTGKKSNIPFTRVLGLMSEKSINVDDRELLKLRRRIKK